MPDTAIYRRAHDMDNWHRRVECSRWPADDAPELETIGAAVWRPSVHGPLCPQCRAKSQIEEYGPAPPFKSV